MTMLDEGFRAAVADNGVLLLPERPPRVGPVTRYLLTRTAVLLASQVVLGTIVLFLTAGGGGRAFGLGLVFPGAGFLLTASPLGLVVTAALVVVAVVLWWGISAHLAIPLVWWGSAIAAAIAADGPRLFVDRGTTWEWAVPFAYVALGIAVGLTATHYERRYRARLAAVPELNAYLATATAPDPVSARMPLTDVDRALVRWTHEMALQRPDGFEGFDWGEQIHGPTCVRYQLDFLTWALALHAVNHVPNAPVTVERAMAALIERQTDIRIWGYWRTLNRIGNFCNDPDPIVRDNIMFSAYLLDVINLYEAATGSDRFDMPGSLTFVWKDGRTFSYDHASLAAAVHRNLAESPLGMFPCEPGWVFTACNTFAAQGLAGHARLHGSDFWDDVYPHWRRGLEQEMLTPDGKFLHIRSKITGLSFDTGEVVDGEYATTGTNGFADVAPDMALRGRLLALRGADARMAALAAAVDKGVLRLSLPPAPERNTGITTAVPAWTAVLGGAMATGHTELAAAARAGVDAECATGKRWPDRPLTAGVQNTGIHLLIRWATPMSSADLARRGYVAPVGPVLRTDHWPQLLVTEAISPDGERLELAVEPGDAARSHRLRLDGLVPGRSYTLTGGDGAGGVVDVEAVADGVGAAEIDVTVAAPMRLALAPEVAT